MADCSTNSRRRTLYSLLGDLPDRQRPITVETIAVEERDGYTLETLSLDLNGIEPVPALLARPDKAQGGRRRSSTIMRMAAATILASQS